LADLVVFISAFMAMDLFKTKARRRKGQRLQGAICG